MDHGGKCLLFWPVPYKGSPEQRVKVVTGSLALRQADLFSRDLNSLTVGGK